MATNLNFFFSGNLGHDAGVGTDGVLVGALTPTNPSKAILKTRSQAVLAYADDGGAYTDETTAANEATANDVHVLPAVPAVDDAYYWGHATKQANQLDVLIGTQGVGTWTIVWEYWNGSAWVALAGVTDGTTGFTAATGLKAVTFTTPTDWAKCTVDGVNAYWIRHRVSAYTAVTTQPLVTQAWLLAVAGSETYTDDTAALIEATANDVELLPAHVAVGDAFHISYGSRFCKLKLTIGTAKAGGTGTYRWEYWNGTAWAALTNADATVLLTASGTHFLSFAPPSDWVANTAADGPNGEAGYFVRFACTVLTVQPTTIPLGTQGWVCPLNAGDGITVLGAGRFTTANMTAQTASGTAADTVLLLVNITRGTCAKITWTGADTIEVDATLDLEFASGDKLAIVQVIEDGTTEFANAGILLQAA